MQSVVEPARHPMSRVVSADHASGLRIDVVTSLLRVVDADKKDGEWPLMSAIEVVTVVLAENANLCECGFGGPGEDLAELLVAKPHSGRPVDWNDAGVPLSQRR